MLHSCKSRKYLSNFAGYNIISAHEESRPEIDDEIVSLRDRLREFQRHDIILALGPSKAGCKVVLGWDYPRGKAEYIHSRLKGAWSALYYRQVDSAKKILDESAVLLSEADRMILSQQSTDSHNEKKNVSAMEEQVRLHKLRVSSRQKKLDDIIRKAINRWQRGLQLKGWGTWRRFARHHACIEAYRAQWKEGRSFRPADALVRVLSNIYRKRLYFAFVAWSDLLTLARLRRHKDDRLLVRVEGVPTKKKFDAKFPHVSEFLTIKGFDNKDKLNMNSVTF